MTPPTRLDVCAAHHHVISAQSESAALARRAPEEGTIMTQVRGIDRSVVRSAVPA